MPKFSANLTMMFQEVPFLKRFAASAKAGFKAVEFMFPYEYAIDELQKVLQAADQKIVLFNLPAGDWAGGDRGIAVDPARTAEFVAGVEKAVKYAKILGVPQVNCLVGKKLADIPAAEQRRTMIANLRLAADAMAEVSVKLLVEPLNSRDMPGFTLNTTAQALEVLAEAGHENIFLQYDVYHAQRMEGELAGILRNNLAKIAHIQIADNPGRHQPGTGEINYRWLLEDFDNAGYKGYVGLEYIPTPDSLSSLEWISDYGYSL
ncbi:MAG: hydroxypyruvate isomerase [Veillonellaceae bacterium]|nr:hydroxypyruvate isomerase [Veillonellaceae bacterium]